jgi:hypothetical protein
VTQFQRYIGIDYSGAETEDSSCKGLSSELDRDRDIPTLVGIEHAFSFPLAYFDRHGLSTEGWKHRYDGSNLEFTCFVCPPER